MDLTLFHPKDALNANLKALDRRNSRKGYMACNIYEWIGYYNFSIAYRLLGHYRLYELFKKSKNYPTDISLARAYILQYQATHGAKYFLIRFTDWMQRIFVFGHKERIVQIPIINRQLLHEGAYILLEFLIESEKDFDTAFIKAMAQIQDPRFPYAHLQQPVSQTFVQHNEEHLHNTNLSKNELHIHPVIKDQPPVKTAHGKEKDVFSKKQILILFDLLGEAGKIDRIGLKYASRTEAIAELMHALTGKPKTSWLEILKDFRTSDLYDFDTDGEQRELLNTLTNLAEKFRSAGFRKIAELADKKMREIERYDYS